jgi:signal transduction histidine kinase/ligand-binding sensor domain-containing protein
MRSTDVRPCFDRLWIAFLLSVLVCQTQLGADRQVPRIQQLYHQAWRVGVDMPGGGVIGIAQTSDGYLWVATAGGLYRFDGVRFERPTSADAQRLTGISRIVAGPDGALWILHDERSVSVLKRDRVTTYGQDAMPPGTLLDVAVDRDGAAWIVTGRGAARLVQGRWQAIGADHNVPATGIWTLFIDRQSRVWIGTRDQLLVLRPGEKSFEAIRSPQPILRVIQAPDDAIWVLRADGVIASAFPANGSQWRGQVTVRTLGPRLVFDRNGTLWTTGEQGVLRATREPSTALVGLEPGLWTTETYTNGDGLTGLYSFAILEDREGNVWVGTEGGLDLFRATAFVPSGFPTGIRHGRLTAGPDGSVWMGSGTHPLQRLRDGVVSQTNVQAGIQALHRGRSGSIWAWRPAELWRGTGDHFVRMSHPPPGLLNVRSLVEDLSGVLWLAAFEGDVYTFANGLWSKPGVSGLPTDRGRIHVSALDDTGRIWFGYEKGGLAIVDGSNTRVLSADDGLRVGRVLEISPQQSHTWVSGMQGLAIVTNDSVRMIDGLDARTVGVIGAVVENGDGLWLNSDRGVVHVDTANLQQVLATPGQVPAFRVFNQLDGAIGGALTTQSAVATIDGRLWFLGFDRVVSVEPSRISANSVTPIPLLRKVRVDDQEYEPVDGLRLPIGTTRLQISYAGVSLAMPDRVRFRYRLDGVDPQWQEAGGAGEASYANLSPGNYRFAVMAANGDGLWSDHGAAIDFVLPPAFHQTAAFRTVMGLALVGLGWLGYRLRVRHVTSQLRERLQERLAERERIARELHDTLLQSVQGLILRFQAVATRLPEGETAATMMEETLARADQVLAEGRDRVKDLRAATENLSLPEALALAGQELSRHTATRFSLVIEGEPRSLQVIVRDEVYWIVREALVNAFQHAHGHRVEVDIAFSSDEFRLRCRDDGCGIDSDTLREGGRDEHWGLRGMRERAARIGARFDVWSRSDAGTEVELRVPASRAYLGARVPWLRKLTAVWR